MYVNSAARSSELSHCHRHVRQSAVLSMHAGVAGTQCNRWLQQLRAIDCAKPLCQRGHFVGQVDHVTAGLRRDAHDA